MDNYAFDLACVLTGTIEKMVSADQKRHISLPKDCIRVLAETIDAICSGRIEFGVRRIAHNPSALDLRNLTSEHDGGNV